MIDSIKIDFHSNEDTSNSSSGSRCSSGRPPPPSTTRSCVTGRKARSRAIRNASYEYSTVVKDERRPARRRGWSRPLGVTGFVLLSASSLHPRPTPIFPSPLRALYLRGRAASIRLVTTSCLLFRFIPQSAGPARSVVFLARDCRTRPFEYPLLASRPPLHYDVSRFPANTRFLRPSRTRVYILFEGARGGTRAATLPPIHLRSRLPPVPPWTAPLSLSAVRLPVGRRLRGTTSFDFR